jgi:peptidoglycan hydrolase CwlO-like protein
MKNGNSSFLLLVLICLLGYNIYSTKQLKTDIDMYNQKIDSIQHNIDSVVLVNKNLDIKIDSIYSEIGLLDTDIESVHTNIKNIKVKTNEKVNSVNQFNFSDLTKFFSDRYESETGSN